MGTYDMPNTKSLLREDNYDTQFKFIKKDIFNKITTFSAYAHPRIRVLLSSLGFGISFLIFQDFSHFSADFYFPIFYFLHLKP